MERRSRSRNAACLAVRSTLVAVLVLCAALPATAQDDAKLAMAQRFLDQGDPTQALQIIDGVLKKDKRNAQAFLLRSTGRIMAGDLASGFDDLQKALDLDPGLRRGWLNLAGLEIAERQYQAAYDALLEAQKLDPRAADNDLNLGAVLVLQGKPEPAQQHFDRYLEAQGASAEAQFLVASNYAIGGKEERAIEHLRRSIQIDEHYRMRARTDERFLSLSSLDFKVLLNTDFYTPPAGAHQVAAAFRVPYSQKDNKLLYAVLDSLKQLGEPYEPQIEANPRWALIWAKMRIKVTNQSGGTGVVSLSAPKDSIAADEWHRRSQALFRAIHQTLGG
ncbi:MAG: tetratricopeptide repeat protein [bacterium]|nr:tetratricopeptide repeat protein [bacterium]